jgi:hypothetical protein
MSRFEWKLLAKWTLPSLLGERRDRREPARSMFRPRVDALEGRALLSHIAAAATKHATATPTTIFQQTGGNGSNGSGGGGGVSIGVGGAGVLTPTNGHNLLGGATLSGPLPVVHVFNSKGKVIGVMPVLPLVSVGQQTGGNGSVNSKTGAGSGGGGGVSVLFAPELLSLPKFGLIHGKLYKIFPPANTPAISVVQKTGGNGAGGGGGGGGVSLLIPFQVSLQTVRVKNVTAVKIVVVSAPAAGTSTVATVFQQTGGNGSNGGGGGGGFGILL